MMRQSRVYRLLLRNQPRKRIDITIEAFTLFAYGKPENVKLYLHMGTKDAGWNVLKLIERYGIDGRVILTSNQSSIQSVPVEKLNLIYNATDIGLNTSLGEGWSLTNAEHSAVGIPQIVPSHSACGEIWQDCGLLIPSYIRSTDPNTLTTSFIVRPEDTAAQLERLYQDKEFYKTLSQKTLEKFTSDTYSWNNVSKQFQEVIEKCLSQ